MLRYKYLLILFAYCSISIHGMAQEVVPPPQGNYASSFAIVVDNESYQACRTEVVLYRDLLVKEGLGAYILAHSWRSPEQVKQQLQDLYKKNKLEGAVFIGNIPIPMIRDAQHLTSAFKMDQQRYPMNESSVPSDRFYDDFNLKFDYLGDDPEHPLFFYYSLRADSPQIINCSIYSGRIKPTKEGAEGHAQISAFLKKAVAEHSQANPLDVLCSYTGEGSYSNSLAAWKDERICLREQLPAAFTGAHSSKFFLFYMEPYMKETLSNQLRRPELDLMLFHEHGTPDRQYLTGIPIATDEEAYIQWAKKEIRYRLRTADRWGRTSEEVWKEISLRYGIDSTWKEGAFDPALIKSDSIETAMRGIELDDVPLIAPNARFVIFDACYNGDFREDRYIGAEYIFASGKTVSIFGNTVNVLQDKSAGDLLGMLGMGFRVGEWARQVNILESHITGDPTLRFTPSTGMSTSQIQINNPDAEYWKRFLGKEQPADVQALALYRLFVLRTPGLSGLLRNTYMQSPYYMVRLQCMHLLPHYGGRDYYEVLKKAVYDPYEFIRRKAVYDMGRTGMQEFSPYVVDLCINDALSERVAFNAEQTMGLLDAEQAYIEARKARGENGNFHLPGSSLSKMVEEALDPSQPLKSRLTGISILRNNPYTRYLDPLLALMKNDNEPLELRIALVEALGWYIKSYRRADIVKACEELTASISSERGNQLTNEATKTANRLKEWMRE